MSILSISNIINVSVATVQIGVNNYSTSNLAIFSDEQPDLGTFGSLGYAIYLSPEQVGIDFGTSSKTFEMANGVFSQQPNILSGGGVLVVILMITTSQTLSFSGIAASGTFEVVSTYGTSAAINWNDSASVIQQKLRAVVGQEGWIVTGSIASELLTIHMAGNYGPVSIVSTTANTLATSGPVAITITPAITIVGESLAAAISRTVGLVQYFGIMATESVDVIGQVGLLAAAAVIQPLLKVGFFVSHVSADIAPGGMLDLLRSGSLSHSRGLYYGQVTSHEDLVFMASYAGLALSTNFNGSNTTQTMNLKSLPGVQADLTMTETFLQQAKAAGADTYPSLQGVSCVIQTGANTEWDQIYGTLWFAGALQVAGFNYLATTSTKIPQTESGMDGLKGAYRNICNQAVNNQFSAPGQWNSATTFGDPAKLLLNVAQFGYYIYSVPIAQQSQASRVAREAPLCSIAIKLAGAIQSSTVIVYVNQ